MILQERLLHDNVFVFKPSTVFEDYRGQYIETFNKAAFDSIMKAELPPPSADWPDNIEFVCDDVSISRKGVFRGIHGDYKTWKLISCLKGSFYLVIVDNDANPPPSWRAGLTISDRNHLQVLIPPGYGNGHLVLEEGTIFHYKQSTYYDRESQFTIHWRDILNLWLPFEPEILSVRDEG